MVLRVNSNCYLDWRIKVMKDLNNILYYQLSIYISKYLQEAHLVLSHQLPHGVQHHPINTDNTVTLALLRLWTNLSPKHAERKGASYLLAI